MAAAGAALAAARVGHGEDRGRRRRLGARHTAPAAGGGGPVRFWSEMVRNVEERLRQGLLRSRRTWDQPDDPVGHRDMALFLIQTGELRKAESQLEEALREQPGWPEAQQLLATIRRTREL